jgi:hypothetical protein
MAEDREKLLGTIKATRNEASASVMRKASDAEVLEYVASLRRSPPAGAMDPANPPAAQESPVSKAPAKDDDDGLAQRQKHALAFIDKAIQPINREIIHKAIPGLNRDKYIEFAAVVAELRAEYLAAALAYFLEQRRSHGGGDSDAVRNLRGKREAYEEALAAYEALHRALERGYVDPVE